jgi:hypothetical protein
VTQTCALFVTVCQNYVSLIFYQSYFLYIIASLPVILILIWIWQRYVNKWEAVLLKGKQRLCRFTNTFALSVTTNCQIAWRKMEQNIFQNNQLCIYFNITFYHYSTATHITSILCMNFYIFRSFYRNKGTYGITDSHHILIRFRPYLLVSSGGITYIFFVLQPGSNFVLYWQV